MTSQRLAVSVTSQITYAAAQAPPEMTRALRDRLRVPNPGYAAAERMGRPSTHVPRWLYAVTESDGRVHLPRGAMQILREVAREHSVRLAPMDERVMPAERVEVVWKPSLRTFQQGAVDAFVEREQGVINFPAGAGKTRTALVTIARLGTPTLVLVGQLDLAEQWRNVIRADLGIEAGNVGRGTCDVCPVTVATIQSLVRMTPWELDQLLGRFGLLIVDECHHAAASTYSQIINRCPARYRVGLTATPEREDGTSAMVTWLLGQVVAKVEHADLIEVGYLLAAEIKELRTTYRFDYAGPDDWTALLEDIVQDEQRNRLIVGAIAEDVRAGHVVLAMTGRVAHAEHLSAELEARGIVAQALVGRVSKHRRSEILDAARAGGVQVLVATQLADEGLDVPRLSRVYQCFPAKAAGRTEQRLGRVMRLHPDVAEAAIVDVVDPHVGVLAHQARQRRAVYERVLGERQPRPMRAVT